MEALGGAASIITVTSLALQSAKAVYATVNGIRNGPKEINDLASALNHLSHILEQVTEISNSFCDTDRTDLSGLRKAMEECARSLADFRKQVEKLDVLPDEGKLGKVWKRVKVVLEKEDFRRMCVTVDHYISVFGTHLSLIGRRRDHYHKDEFARHMLQTRIDSQALKQNNDLLEQLENGLSGVESGLTSLAGMSMAQYETMMEKLAQIQEELKASAVHAHDMFTPKVSSPDNSKEEKAENHTDDDHASNELSESIDRLCGLATKPRTTACSDDAQQIITDLEKILSLISREAKSPGTRETRKRKQDQLADLESAEVSRYSKRGLRLDLKRLQGLLTSSPRISVNEQASFDTKTGSENRRHRKAAFQKYATTIGAISVQVKTRRLLKNANQIETNVLTGKSDQEVEDIFEGTVSFIPKKPDWRTKISTSFFQRSTKDGFFSFSPRLSFCAIIPDSSEIFALVSRGDLKGIINHLQQGKASLSDCDSKGRTLLNYALYCLEDKVCEFLIDKGADVDAMEPMLPRPGIFDDTEYEDEVVTPLNRISKKYLTDGDCKKEDFASTLRCRRLLLNAGADPMPDDSFGELFGNAEASLTSGRCGSRQDSGESLAMILNLGGEFINYECEDEIGQTMLLRCSVGNGYGLNPYNIKLLIDRGANLMARDPKGDTCLHLALESVRNPRRVSEKASLLFMVKAGADVYAVNDKGISVSDVAYTFNKRDQYKNLGTYRGDLWDEVLTECGYDATGFAKTFEGAILTNGFRN